MSAIPPSPLVASVLQSDAAQRRQVAERTAEESRPAAISRELTAVDKAVEVEIEATDADTRVHTDAGGQGSYGRHDDRDDQGHAHADAGGGSSDSDISQRVDIQA